MDYLSFFTVCWFWGFHYIADFIFQTHSQAQNKSRSNQALAHHCWVYTLIMSLATTIYFVGFSESSWGLFHIAFTVMYLFSTHFITDYFTSRKSSKYFKRKRNHLGFVIIGLDQYIHFLTIMVPLLIIS